MPLSLQKITRCLVAIVFLFISLQCFSQETIDLPQAIKYALVQNRGLARSALDVDSNTLGIAMAKAEFRLNIRPEVSLGLFDNQGSSRYGIGASKKLAWGTTLSVSSSIISDKNAGDNSYRAGLQLEIQQPIFRNFGTLIHGENLIQASNNLKTAQRRLELEKANLIIDVVQAYENILLLNRQVHSDQESSKRMDRLYRITKAKEFLGRTTRIDTLRVELLRGQALLRLQATQEHLSSAQRDFANLLGFPINKIFKLVPTLTLKYKVLEADEAINVALKNRLDYAQALQDHEDFYRGARISQRRLLPNMNLVARKEWVGERANLADASPRESKWTFGVSFDMDFNLAKERAALGIAHNYLNSSSKAIEITELSIARQVHQQLLVYKRTQSELKIATRNLSLASSRAKLARRLFELGRGDNFSVTDAEEAFLQAENQLFSAQEEASLAGYRLSYILGTLIESPEVLKPISIQRSH